MKSYITVLMVTFSLFAVIAKAEACSPENVARDILMKQKNISGSQFYVSNPIIKVSSIGQVYEFHFSSIGSDGAAGEIGSIEIQRDTCKVVKFSAVSSFLLN